jgi:myo-inositol 2-dehydrogenase/D-chiro-inositol 1-dehydrogenase
MFRSCSGALLPIDAQDARMRDMRVGVAGVGRIGSVHARNLAAVLPEDSLFLYDVDPASARRAAADAGGVTCPSPEALVDSVDALVIATPATERSSVLAAAMAKGIPVFCEKPLAATVAEARAIAEAARETGTRVQVGFQRRFDPDYRALHQLVGSGAAGQVLMIRGTAFDRQPPSAGYQLTSGDIFTDCLIHDIDAARWIAHDEVVEVQGDAREVGALPGGGPGIGIGTVVLTFANGGVAVLTASRLNPHTYDHRMEVLGTRNSAVAGPGPVLSPQAAGQPGSAPTFTGFEDRFAAAYRAEMHAFLAMAGSDEPSLCDPCEALRAQEIAAAAAAAARAGTRMPVPPRQETLVG